MKGSVYQRRGGAWEYRFDLGPDPLTGKRRQTTKTGFRTKREAAAAMRAAMTSAEKGRHVAPSRRTVAAYLNEWHAARQPNLRATTWTKYRNYKDLYVIPAIGDTALQELTPVRLELLYAHLLQAGRARPRAGQSSGLAPSSVASVHRMLSTALGDAVKWGYVTRNAAADARPPRVGRTRLTVWPPEELRRFIDHVKGERLYALWLLVVTTGLRRGEMAGLRRGDVDLVAGTVCPSVTRVVVDGRAQDSDPKTEESGRTLALDPVTTRALSDHIARWEREREEYGHTTDRLFCWPDGRSIHPDTLTGWFQQLAAQVGLPVIRLHDVRHSYATAAIKAGIHPKIVSARLGHADVAFTMRVYGHLLPGMDQDAADQVARLILGEAVDPPANPGARNSARKNAETPLPVADHQEGGWA